MTETRTAYSESA